MKKKFRYALIIGIISTGLLPFLIGEASVQYSSQPPFNYTGAEGSTCAQCHGNFNNGDGSIATTGLPTGVFRAGEPYNFSITLTHPTTRGRWGFSIGARDANNQPVGVFSSTNPNAAPNVTELSHFMAVFQTGNSFTYDNLTWTAPVNPTEAQKAVTFYYIGNAANGNMSLTGDFIYSGTKNVLFESVNQLPAVQIASPPNNTSIPAGGFVSLSATASDPDGTVSKVVFYNQGIPFYVDSVAPYGIESNNEIEPGNYTISAKAFDNRGDSALSNTVNLIVTGCTPSGSLTGEAYLNITGTQVSDLLNNSAYPNNPTVRVQLANMQYSDVGSQYGARLSGYICAPMTGNYIFYISGDDQCGLFLSTDANPSKKVLVAYNENFVGFEDWFHFPTQKSVPIKLVKGGRYYFETLHKQSTGSDHLSVGWIMPDGTPEAPIGGNRLSPVESQQLITSTQSFQSAIQNKLLAATVSLIVKASPNPSIGYFNINIGSKSREPISIVLTDVLGRVCEKRANMSSNGTIQVGSKLMPGIYFLEVSQGSQKERIKLIRK